MDKESSKAGRKQSFRKYLQFRRPLLQSASSRTIISRQASLHTSCVLGKSARACYKALPECQGTGLEGLLIIFTRVIDT